MIMENTAFHLEREIAVAAVREAAALCRAVQAGIFPDVIQKKDRSPVTVADFGSQALVCRMLSEAFPEDPVIGEENADALRTPENAATLEKVVGYVRAVHPEADASSVAAWIDHGGTKAYSDRFWTLDPIDGTKGFLRGEQYAIALALIVGGEVTVAAMACPNLPVDAGAEEKGVVFAAIRRQSVVRAPLDGDGAGAPVHVSALADVSKARFCESVESGHSSHGDAARVAEYLGITAEPVRLDSQAKYAVVARGEADIYMRLPTRPGYVEKIWDHAAGMLVVVEAGGKASDIYGRPLEFNHGYRLENNRGVIVSNGLLHDELIAALKALGVAA